MIALSHCAVFARAQQDSTWISYQGGFNFREGIYADFQSFRSNSPTWPIALLTDQRGQAITDLRRADRVFVPDSAGRKEIVLDRQWGFCNNDVVYLWTSQGFYRIGMWGTLSHVVFDHTYRTFDPYYGGTMGQTVQLQYLLDIETGAFQPFQASTLEVILPRDQVLFDEWSALSKKEKRQDEVLHRFLRRYNERHPLYFPR